MKNRFASFAMIALFAGSGYATAQKVSVRWVFEEGAEFVFRTTMSMSTIIDMPGGQGMITTKIVSTQTQTWSVLDVAANGDATLRITTDRVQMDMEGPMGNVSADSDSDQESTNLQLRMATALAGTSYTYVLGSDGQIKDVQGIEEMLKHMRASLPPDTVAMFDQAMFDQMMGQTFTAESMKGEFQQSFGSFPTESIGPGDIWDTTYSKWVPMIGAVTIQTTSTLDRIEDRGSRVAIISSTSDGQMTGDAEGQFAGMMQIDNMSMIGTIEFDIDRGRLLKSALTVTMEATMTMGGQEMAMSSINKTIVELVEG